MTTQRRILYIDMDNVLVDFPSGLAAIPEPQQREFEGHADDIPGIFARMKPMAGAVAAFTELVGLYDTYILSTAPWHNPSAWSDKLLWVQKYLGKSAYKRLILSHHKNLNDGDFLVDDRTKHGVLEFKGEHIHFGQDPYRDWAATLPYLRGQARYTDVGG